MYCRHCLSVYGPLALKIRHKASSKFSGHKFDKYMHGPLVHGSDNFALTFFFLIFAKLFSYFYFISYLNSKQLDDWLKKGNYYRK